MEGGKPLKMPLKTSSSPQKCKMKRFRIYITLCRGTRNLVNGTKNGANMPEEPTWMMLLRCTHSAELWILLSTKNYSKCLRCQIYWLDLLRKPENSIRTGIPLLALLGVSDDRTHAFRKSWKKNLRSMLYHDLLYLDRTEDKVKVTDVEEVVDVADLPWNNENSASITTSASTVANLDISPSIVLNCQTTDLVPAFDHRTADLPSNRLIPFQKKGWTNFHSKTKVELTSPLLTSLNHWSRSI